MNKVLFLTVSSGGGHTLVAKNIADCISGNIAVKIVDVLKYGNPIIHTLVIGSYLNTVKCTPSLYKELYKATDDIKVQNTMKRFSKALAGKIDKLIADYNPDVVVCTHPLAAQIMSEYNKKNKRVKTLVVMTDYAVHSFWIHDNLDHYIVGNESMERFIKNKYKNLGASIYPYGIPTRKEFLVRKDRGALLKKFKLKNMTTVLIMGGSLGYGDIKKAYIELLEYKENLQIIVVCGKNAKLQKDLLDIDTDKDVKVIGYTENIHDYMDISDFIITKPGGLTTTEAILKNIPMLLLEAIPGQEVANEQFLLNNGMAAKIFNTNDLCSILEDLIKNKDRIFFLKSMQRHYSKKNSRKNIRKLFEDKILK